MDVRNVFDSARAIRVRGEGAFKMAGEPRGQGDIAANIIRSCQRGSECVPFLSWKQCLSLVKTLMGLLPGGSYPYCVISGGSYFPYCKMSFSPEGLRLTVARPGSSTVCIHFFLTWKLLLLLSNTIFETKVLFFHDGSFVFTADINITFGTFSFSNQLSNVDLNVPMSAESKLLSVRLPNYKRRPNGFLPKKLRQRIHLLQFWWSRYFVLISWSSSSTEQMSLAVYDFYVWRPWASDIFKSNFILRYYKPEEYW